jgi:hypothetical protein
VATIESIGSSTRSEGSRLADRDVERRLSRLQLESESFTSRDERQLAGYVGSQREGRLPPGKTTKPRRRTAKPRKASSLAGGDHPARCRPSPPTPWTDRSMPENQGSMPTIDHSIKNIEGSMSAIERSMKNMEHFISLMERSMKKMEHFIPLMKRFMKKMEHFIPLMERSMKKMERFIPTIDASVKNMKRSSLAMNHSLPTTEGFSTDRERFANLGQLVGA